MNTNPSVRNPAHGLALENYRVAELRLRLHVNRTNNSEGRNAQVRDSSEYDALVDARDETRDRVPTTEKPSPKAKKKGKR